MKIRYEARKGLRIKKGYTITTKGKRRNFSGVECRTSDKMFWWAENANKWFSDLDNDRYTLNGFSSHKTNIYNLKSLIRFSKKHQDYLPKGTVLTLCSNFEGHNIYCIL